jgi:hypothetical protein
MSFGTSSRASMCFKSATGRSGPKRGMPYLAPVVFRIRFVK